MKASELIQKLKKIVKVVGDFDILVDTDAAKFNCHLVDTTGVEVVSATTLGDLIYLTLDEGCKE